MDMRKQRNWIESIEKENRLRLTWFRKNERRLEECAEKPSAREVPQELKDEVRETRQNTYRNAKKFPRIKTEDALPPAFDEDAILNVMRPIDPDIKKLLYMGAEQNGGRLNYLKHRVKLIPETKYYYPETTSFRYGWNMWNNAKTRINLGNGRQQVIKNSFYRRRGVARDPDWYKEPAQLSPSVCGCV